MRRNSAPGWGLEDGVGEEEEERGSWWISFYLHGQPASDAQLMEGGRSERGASPASC